MAETTVIVAAKRTPIGTLQGAFANTPAPELGASAIKAVLSGTGVDVKNIEACLMGNVLTAGIGQAPARQAALKAGLLNSTDCLTINKVCSSGLKAVMIAADLIQLGRHQVIIAGGQENMSLAPHLLENSRSGYRLGPISAADSMVKDGLWDPYHNFHMGKAGELCAKEYKVGREEQDAFAIESYKKAQAAMRDGLFKNETAAVEVKAGKEIVRVEADEEPGKAKFDKMPGLKPAFDPAGTITAANASKVNDGGAALLLMTESKAKELGLKPLAKVLAQGTHSHQPEWFTTAPVGAMKKALQNANLKISDIDLFEINEAFSVVTMVAVRELGIENARVNVHGGAVALGHPIGASGARILTTLIHALHAKGAKRGMASLCNGGGEATALIIEKV